jgi:hypothetical protein
MQAFNNSAGAERRYSPAGDAFAVTRLGRFGPRLYRQYQPCPIVRPGRRNLTICGEALAFDCLIRVKRLARLLAQA